MITAIVLIHCDVDRIPEVAQEIAELDGVSPQRAHQLVAGAVVAEVAMRRLKLERLDICPWALREGMILRWLDLAEVSS